MSQPIHDAQGNVIGYQDRDGTFRDKDNRKVGYINTRKGTVFDNQNQEVGFIDGDGNVIDRYRRRLGKIGSDGTVQDWHGIQVYSGSAAPLLLDFDGVRTQEPDAERLDFDQMARQAASPSEFEQEVRKDKAATPRERIVGALTQEGFVSPSVIGCLAIIGALLVGAIIMVLFQNPSFLLGPGATPTRNAVANATEVADDADATPDAAVNPTAVPAPQEAIGKVNTQILNLREGPATSFEIVDRLQQDTQVVIAGRLSDSTWLKVTVPSIGKEGWVAAEYITMNFDVGTLPVVEPPAD